MPNEKLACTAVYGVFAPYTAGGHRNLDIQRNFGCDPCPSHPRLPSHLHLESPPDQNPVENELLKLEIGLAKLDYPFKKWVRLIRFRVSATRFPPDFGRAGIRGEMTGETRVGTDMYHSRNSAVYPDFCGLQPYKEQKLRKRLYMLISHLALTVNVRKVKKYKMSSLTKAKN